MQDLAVRHCPNPDCPDLLDTGVPQEFTYRVSRCPACSTALADGPPPEPGVSGFASAPTDEIGLHDESLPALDPSQNCRGCGAPLLPGQELCLDCAPEQELSPRAQRIVRDSERAVLRRSPGFRLKVCAIAVVLWAIGALLGAVIWIAYRLNETWYVQPAPRGSWSAAVRSAFAELPSGWRRSVALSVAVLILAAAFWLLRRPRSSRGRG